MMMKVKASSCLQTHCVTESSRAAITIVPWLNQPRKKVFEIHIPHFLVDVYRLGAMMQNLVSFTREKRKTFVNLKTREFHHPSIYQGLNFLHLRVLNRRKDWLRQALREKGMFVGTLVPVHLNPKQYKSANKRARSLTLNLGWVFFRP